jgi:cytochrome c nitrite reductase small subunit
MARSVRRVVLRGFALTLCILLGLMFGVGGYTFYYAEGASYLSDDPKSCVNCHIMRDVYESWQHASHHAVATCNDCHVPHGFVGKYLSKAENGFFHSKAFTLQDFEEPIRIKPRNARVLQQNCLECHRDLVHSTQLADTKEAGTCVHCHPSVGHGPPR